MADERQNRADDASNADRIITAIDVGGDWPYAHISPSCPRAHVHLVSLAPLQVVIATFASYVAVFGLIKIARGNPEPVKAVKAGQ